jgi:hypothetical protein
MFAFAPLVGVKPTFSENDRAVSGLCIRVLAGRSAILSGITGTSPVTTEIELEMPPQPPFVPAQAGTQEHTVPR